MRARCRAHPVRDWFMATLYARGLCQGYHASCPDLIRPVYDTHALASGNGYDERHGVGTDGHSHVIRTCSQGTRLELA